MPHPLIGGPSSDAGEKLPDFSLPAPADPAEMAYLGLLSTGAFRIPQIKAQLVIIEIYSMYCPYCQREAPIVNELFRKIEKDPRLSKLIKIIGIGVGNTKFEVAFFRKKYHIPFPLFPDGSYYIHKRVKEVRTPYFFGVRIHSDGSHRVIYSQLGGIKDADGFLKKILKLSGLEQEG